MIKSTFQLLMKCCEFYHLRDMDGMLAAKIQEIDEYVKQHRTD